MLCLPFDVRVISQTRQLKETHGGCCNVWMIELQRELCNHSGSNDELFMMQWHAWPSIRH